MKSKWIIVGILALALVLICGAIGIVSLFTLRSGISSSPGFDFNPFQVGQISVDETEEKTFEVAGPATLDLETPFGDITVTGGEGSEIAITANKRAYGANQAAAEQAMENLIVVMTQDGETVRVRVETPRNGWVNNQGGSVSFVVSVPEQTTTLLSTDVGKVDLSGTQGKADITSDFGDVQVRDFAGGLLAHSNSGEVAARRIGTLEDGSGDVDLTSDFGQVRLEDAVTQEVNLHSNSGEVTLNNVQSEGKAVIESDFGSLTFTQGSAGSLNANTRSGSVELADLKVAGSVTAHSDFGEIGLENVEGQSYTLTSNSGTITLKGARGEIEARSDFGDIDIKNSENATLTLESENGTISYRGSLAGSGTHTITAGFGDVTLILPSDSAFDFDLTTGFGDIEVDFPIQIDGKPDENHWVGAVNGGGTQLTVSTDNGSLNIEMSEER